MPPGGTKDENYSPFEGGAGGCLCREPDGTFQQDTPAAQWLLPLSREIFVGVLQ